MLKKKIKLSTGAEIEIREMNFGEIRKVRDESAALPLTWPIEQQLGPETLDPLPMSDVLALARAIYDLSYGTGKSEGN